MPQPIGRSGLLTDLACSEECVNKSRQGGRRLTIQCHRFFGMAMVLLGEKSNKLAADTSPVAIDGSSDSKTQIAQLSGISFDCRMVYRKENPMLTNHLLKKSVFAW
ncbi:hypothetical protein [Methylomonas albis]|uniref:Uncharacterized protein n=1 Tax=Methylomonas albis TaxID=1854563 RepID=A0ABR9D1Y4_9GAMM|nr:hypothetical protein [Methylomonas albis]MBD9357138.1 hypothetical protein [Methylomonas albis]CAD6880358.1 hypothetical protein [Methylomonas albis]